MQSILKGKRLRHKMISFLTMVHGIGFGLSIANMIIEKHGGGAAFTVALPRTRKEEKQT